ncbi:hypothetical protein BDZ89DRAFT_1069686 [Hymenopellis radicata]|nr:hypothetical protein BDZ89DRAFT_1069686 [Hymenopellis radicata]
MYDPIQNPHKIHGCESKKIHRHARDRDHDQAQSKVKKRVATIESNESRNNNG